MVATDNDLDSDLEHLQPLHRREYEVQSYIINTETILIWGRVKDTKPPGVYFEEDPEPLEIHKMVIDLTIGFPNLVIGDVAVEMQTHPHGYCPNIVEHYRGLIGLSICPWIYAQST